MSNWFKRRMGDTWWCGGAGCFLLWKARRLNTYFCKFLAIGVMIRYHCGIFVDCSFAKGNHHQHPNSWLAKSSTIGIEVHPRKLLFLNQS